MDLIKRKKGKILAIVIIALLAIIGVVLLWIRIMVNRYNKVLQAGGRNLYVVPVEETWENIPGGEEISLGYAVISIDPNEIESIRRIFSAGALIKLKSDAQYMFIPPNVGFSKEELLSSIPHGLSENDRQMVEKEFLKYNTFEGKKEIYFTQPVTFRQFFRMDSLERVFYYGNLVIKSAIPHEGGIIIFEAPNIKGFMHRRTKNALLVCEIFSNKGEIQQAISVNLRVIEEEEEKVKSILASLRYTMDELPSEEELEGMVKEAIEKLPWYVEEDKDKDKNDRVGQSPTLQEI